MVERGRACAYVDGDTRTYYATDVLVAARNHDGAQLPGSDDVVAKCHIVPSDRCYRGRSMRAPRIRDYLDPKLALEIAGAASTPKSLCRTCVAAILHSTEFEN